MTTKIKTYHVMTSDGFKSATLYSLQDLDYQTILSHDDLIDNILDQMRKLLIQFNEEDYYSINQVSLKALMESTLKIPENERIKKYIKTKVEHRLSDEEVSLVINDEVLMIKKNIDKLVNLETGVKYILQGNAILNEKIEGKNKSKNLYISKNGFEDILLEHDLIIEIDPHLKIEHNQYGMYIKAGNYVFIITIENTQSSVAKDFKLHNDIISKLDPLFAYQLFKVIEANLSPAKTKNKYRLDYNNIMKNLTEKLINKIISKINFEHKP